MRKHSVSGEFWNSEESYESNYEPKKRQIYFLSTPVTCGNIRLQKKNHPKLLRSSHRWTVFFFWEEGNQDTGSLGVCGLP